jgi:hypothetical protein
MTDFTLVTFIDGEPPAAGLRVGDGAAADDTAGGDDGATSVIVFHAACINLREASPFEE